MTAEDKLAKALDLLERAGERFEETPPDAFWWENYFQLTGQHMILTDEGWQDGRQRSEISLEYGEDAILKEVNAPIAN